MIYYASFVIDSALPALTTAFNGFAIYGYVLSRAVLFAGMGAFSGSNSFSKLV